MKKILFISDHLSLFADDIKSLTNQGYLVDTAKNYQEVLSICISKGYYHYSIIDLEFDNQKGDKLALDLRYNLSSNCAIIGLYSMYLKSIPKTNYKLSGFNYCTTFPVLTGMKYSAMLQILKHLTLITNLSLIIILNERLK